MNINLNQSAQAKSLLQTCLLLGFLNPCTTDTLDTYSPTQRLAESLVTFERLDNRNILILQKRNTAGKTYKFFGILSKKSIVFYEIHREESIISIALVFKL